MYLFDVLSKENTHRTEDIEVVAEVKLLQKFKIKTNGLAARPLLCAND